MPKLPKFTLEYNEKKDHWDLRNDKSDRLIKAFATKEKATSRGTLRKAVGIKGGSIKIQKGNGRFQEERTYPKSKDPAKSKG